MIAGKNGSKEATTETIPTECPKLARLSSAENFTVNIVNEDEFNIIKKYYKEIVGVYIDNKDFSVPHSDKEGPSMIKGIAKDVLKDHTEVYLIRKSGNKVVSYFVFLKPKEL